MEPAPSARQLRPLLFAWPRLATLGLALIQHPEGGESEEELRTATVQAPWDVLGGREHCDNSQKQRSLAGGTGV